MAAVSNNTFKLGETWNMDVVAHDSLGNVINLTGCTIRYRVVLAGIVLLDLAIGSGITIVNAVAGEFLISVTPAMQAAAAGIASAFCQHQCRVLLADGVTQSDQFYGSLTVLPSLF